MSKKFYLAGSFADRVRLKELAVQVERMTGYTCTSRWLEGKQKGNPPELIAREDIEDLDLADGLLLVHGASTCGGMWVELGYMVAKGKPVVIYKPHYAKLPLSVFCYHTGIIIVPELTLIPEGFRAGFRND